MWKPESSIAVPAAAIDHRAEISLALTALIGEYSLLIMPFILVAMMQTDGISEAAAGRLVSLQLLFMAIASGLVSAHLRPGRSVRPILVVGAVLILLANSTCALLHDAVALASARAVTGFGEGAVMAAASAAVCATANPHRLFAMIGTAVAVAAAAALFATPLLTLHGGPSSVFWLLAFVPLLLLPCLSQIPVLGDTAAAAAAAHGSSRVASAALLLAFFLLWGGASGLWVYAERIGTVQGLTPTRVGMWLSIGQLAGIPGPIVAALLGPRLGLRPSLAMGCAGMAGAAVLFVFGGQGWTYGLGACLASFWIMFVVPCFRSSMAGVDPSGRTVAASAGFYTIGFGAAPLVVAAIHTEGAGYTATALFCVACFLLSAMLASTARPDISRASPPKRRTHPQRG
jgi:predicted MFS family arabinose efflux permease